MHRQHLALLSLSVASLALAPLPSSGQRRDNEMQNHRIETGTLINDARAILTTAKVPPGGARAFAAHPSGEQWMFYTLRDEKVDLVIRYSPRTRKVTDLSLYYIADRRSKASDIAVAASAIQFYQDGSYAVLFPPPRRNAPRSKAENGAGRNQLPLRP